MKNERLIGSLLAYLKGQEAMYEALPCVQTSRTIVHKNARYPLKALLLLGEKTDARKLLASVKDVVLRE
jgi:hypothetical protein